MRISGMLTAAALAAALLVPTASAQQARKWIESDGRVIYSDQQPSKTARLAGAVRTDAQPAGAAEKIEAGKIELVDGQVTVAGADATTRRIVTGSILFEGDTVTTGDKGELHAEMADGAVIAVRANSSVSIVRYRARGQSTDASVMSLLRGSFRAITGFIAKTSPSAYQVRTPGATIGVRGTDHEPMIVAAASAGAAPGVYDKVNAGSTIITANNGGSVTVGAGQAGFVPQGAQGRPQVITAVPAVFRPGANDGRMQGRHATVQQGLGDKRAQAQAGQGMQKEGGGTGAQQNAPGTQNKGPGSTPGKSGTGQTGGQAGSDKGGQSQSQGPGQVSSGASGQSQGGPSQGGPGQGGGPGPAPGGPAGGGGKK